MARGLECEQQAFYVFCQLLLMPCLCCLGCWACRQKSEFRTFTMVSYSFIAHPVCCENLTVVFLLAFVGKLFRLANFYFSWESYVVLYYAEDIGNFYYGNGHPMKPHRVRMAHNLVLSYGLYKKMDIFRPTLISEQVTPLCSMLSTPEIEMHRHLHFQPSQDMARFHSDDYVHFLMNVTPENMNEYSRELSRCTLQQGCEAGVGGSVLFGIFVGWWRCGCLKVSRCLFCFLLGV